MYVYDKVIQAQKRFVMHVHGGALLIGEPTTWLRPLVSWIKELPADGCVCMYVCTNFDVCMYVCMYIYIQLCHTLPTLSRSINR